MVGKTAAPTTSQHLREPPPNPPPTPQGVLLGSSYRRQPFIRYTTLSASAHARPPTRWLGALAMSRRATLTLWAAGLLSVATGAPAVGFGPAAVHNTSPQRTLALVREQWPIYYPRIAYRDAAQAPNATETDRLQRAFLDLHTGMSYQRAAAVAQAVEDRNPHSAAAHYNTACVMARLFRLEASLGALEQAVECGWRDRAHTELDSDLAPLRRSARFRELVDRMEHLAALELAEKKPTSNHSHTPHPPHAPHAAHLDQTRAGAAAGTPPWPTPRLIQRGTGPAGKRHVGTPPSSAQESLPARQR